MKITPSEQKELATYIARKIHAAYVAAKFQTEKEIAEVVWWAIEDYTSTDESGPDALELAKARMEASV